MRKNEIGAAFRGEVSELVWCLNTSMVLLHPWTDTKELQQNSREEIAQELYVSWAVANKKIGGPCGTDLIVGCDGNIVYVFASKGGTNEPRALWIKV